jgi:2-polyprenyl-3-methyl-5-hydroxy-6-metoxy-1,4-benzoquinol methylase
MSITIYEYTTPDSRSNFRLSEIVSWVVPCDAVDLGCGAGNYAVWLASKGFGMTGLDLSPSAFELARDLARQKGVTWRFAARDMTGVLESFDNAFDFAYDYFGYCPALAYPVPS